MKNKNVAFCGVFTALAMIFSYIEALLPISLGVPGAKPGFANIAVLIVLYIAGAKAAFAVDVLRIVLTGMLFGNMASFIFSISGGLLSVLIMIFLKSTNRFSIAGISVAGGVSHNIGQIIAAAAVTKTPGIAYYLPVLLVTGVIAGIINGIVAGIVKKCLHKSGFYDML